MFFLLNSYTVPHWLYFYLPILSIIVGIIGIFNSVFTIMSILSVFITIYGLVIIIKRIKYNL